MSEQQACLRPASVRMNKFTPLVRLGIIAVIAILPLITSCGDSKNREDLALRMALEEGLVDDDERIAALKADIRAVEKQVEKTLESVRDEGSYWRLLGLKYMDYKMWGEAMAAFDEAVKIYPENAALLYNRALSAGQMALSADTPEAELSYFLRSESGYRRAITVNSRHTASMYALSVLLVFELERPFEAVPLLEDFLKIERSDINGRFLLARVYLEAGMKIEALNLYDEITKIARDQTDVIKAEELYRRAAGGGDAS